MREKGHVKRGREHANEKIKQETTSGGEIRADYCVREEGKHKQRPNTQR